MVTGDLELDLGTLGQIDTELLQLIGTVCQLHHVVVSVLGIPLAAKYRYGNTSYSIGVDGDGGYITLNLELHVRGIQGEHIVVTSANELVGTVAVTLLLGSNPVASLYSLVRTSRGTNTILGVEDVPVAVETIGKHKPNRTTDGGGVAVSAIIVGCHLHTSGGIPVAKGHITYDVVCCLRREGQHDHHSKKSNEFFHTQIINLLNNIINEN